MLTMESHWKSGEHFKKRGLSASLLTSDVLTLDFFSVWRLNFLFVRMSLWTCIQNTYLQATCNPRTRVFGNLQVKLTLPGYIRLWKQLVEFETKMPFLIHSWSVKIKIFSKFAERTIGFTAWIFHFYNLPKGLLKDIKCGTLPTISLNKLKDHFRGLQVVRSTKSWPTVTTSNKLRLMTKSLIY